jgi:hypothetical protein
LGQWNTKFVADFPGKDHDIDPLEFTNLAGTDDLKAKLVECRTLGKTTLGINLIKK